MALSPMMQQYMIVKQKYEDCILMYRVGDFYEMFFDDAIKASKILGLTLTGKDCGLDERAPMCGVPYHSVSSYISGLVENGQKVAICEQLTEPIKGSIVKRDVTRVITSGTRIDVDSLDEKSNNFICAISLVDGQFGVAWADISTGELYCAQITEKGDVSSLLERLIKIAPSEIISTSEVCKLKIADMVKGMIPNVASYHDWAFEHATAMKKLKKHFGVNTLEPYGISRKKECVSAVGGLLEYVEDTQKRKLDNLCSVRLIESKNYMSIDSNTFRNLDLIKNSRDGGKFGTLYSLLNKTETPMGARLLTSVIEKPLINYEQIKSRQFAVKELIEDDYTRDSIVELLSKIRDIARLSGRIAYGNATPVDLYSLKNSLAPIPRVKECLSLFNSEKIKELNTVINPFVEYCAYLDSAISENATSQTKDGGYIKEGFNEELDRLKLLATNGKSLILELEEREKERTGIKGLKIGYNRIFGYYIEVSKNFQDQVPLNYVRKQTVANAERYITEELKNLENEILSATENSIKLELKLFNDVINYSKTLVSSLIETAEGIGMLDVLTSFSIVSKNNDYVMPTMDKDGEEISIISGRHPIVEKINKNEQFISNDCYINSTDCRTIILTGPNMAGKSTYMRQIALIALMAQIGCFVPAKSAKLPIFDKIFTRVGASDNLIFDQSTFMVEMIEVSNILHNATKNSLIILDEVGRGTATLDGLAIAFAVVKYITNEIRAKTLFATHYHELTDLEGTFDGVRNYHISVKEINGKIIFLRKILRGGINRSFGIEVASLAGLPKYVIKESRAILRLLEESDAIASKKQMTLDDFNEEKKIDYSKVKEKLDNIDVDEISPRLALDILEELKDMVK